MSWLNAHCHIELSFARGRIAPGLSFGEWLGELIRLRRATPPEEIVRAGIEALSEARATGTHRIYDIDTLGLSKQIVAGVDGIEATLFREALNFKNDEGEAAVAAAIAAQETTPRILHGLSPHTPYSTTAPLLRAAVASGQPLCIHAAETPEETEMFVSDRGALRDFLDPFLDPEWNCPRMRPLEWLDAHGCLSPSTMLVHCNDIVDSDVSLIAARECSVVVCPGSHVYFGRGEFPLARLLAAGVRVYLGTDSLASNESLDMAREVDLATELAPTVDKETIRQLSLLEDDR